MNNPFETIDARLSNIESLLLDLKHIPKDKSSETDTDQLLSIQEAAEFLKLSVPTLYGLVSKAELPVSKRGKRLYFSKQELTEWVKAGRKKTVSELRAEADAYLQAKTKRG